MENIRSTAFNFIGYQITKFNFNSEFYSDSLTIDFLPSGLLKTNSNEFLLEIEAKVSSGNEGESNEIINLVIIAVFSFSEAVKTKDGIPQFFYKNSIAIVFPYIRAFISSLSSQANCGIINLPLLNLSGMETTLIENTKESAE